ncbi:MAG: hypothetical protein RIR97_225 [Pseudomonadota bacterium]|jgi:hypothetical protein
MTDLPIKRMSLIVLAAIAFAILFAQLVNAAPRPLNRVHAGSSISCYHPASPFCVAR